MMRFVFPVLFSVMIAMLFVSFYARLPPPLPFSTSESDLPKPSRPNPLQVLSAPPAPTPDMTSPPVLASAVQTQSAVEAQTAAEILAEIEHAAQAAPEVPTKFEPGD